MRCPRCQSKLQFVRAEDRAVIRYCTSPACDWQMTESDDTEDAIAHNTSQHVARQERRVNGRTGQQR